MKLSETVRIFGKVVLCGLICSGSTRLTAQTVDVQGDTGDSKARLIGGNDQHVDVDGQDRTFAIEGQNNQIRIRGTCHGVTVLGNGNKVDLDQVESLALFGKDNHVTYLGASPSIASAGTNNVAEVRPPDRSQSDSTAQPGGSDSDHLIVLNGSNATFDQQVVGKNVVLNGSSGKAYLHGKAGQLVINGSNNLVSVDEVSSVVFNGSNNVVRYKSGSAPYREQSIWLGGGNSAAGMQLRGRG